MAMLWITNPMCAGLLGLLLVSCPASAAAADLLFLNRNSPIVDAHNCYPYDGRWTDRIQRALGIGFPVSIEQDLAWYVDPVTGKGRVVVSHSAKAKAQDPELRTYFFERVRPVVERSLQTGDSSHWPLIILHFDFKDVQEPLLHAVCDLLGEYREWITMAVKSPDPNELTPLRAKPIFVITEDSDVQAKVFYDDLPVGSELRLFGSAHTNLPEARNRAELAHVAATLPPEQLLSAAATTYRRWWNSSWFVVEEGGQRKAGAWTQAEMTRLRTLVTRAHSLGYWVRFYTLDGFTPKEGRVNGWFRAYNFGSLATVKVRWKAAIEADVNFIATDQYEALAEFMDSQHKTTSKREAISSGAILRHHGN
jgi:hypothetical protein